MSANSPATASPLTQKSRLAVSAFWKWLWLILAAVAALVAAGWFWRYWRVQQQWRQAQEAIQRHDLDAAASYLDRYLAYRPDDAAGWFLAGRTARRRERYSDADTYLTRCQQIGGVNDQTRLEWDLFRIQQGELGDAHTRLRATITPQHPDAPLVLEALARGYLSDGGLRDAVEACDLWIAIEPEHPWPWLWRGGIYERLANFDQALADYQQALEHAPHDKTIRLSLGALLNRGRRPGPAAEHFQHVLGHDPDNIEALLGLANCKIEQGEAAEAGPLLQRVLANDADNARALVLLGKVALEQGDAVAAERHLQRAVERSPHDHEAIHQLILALRIVGQSDEADRLGPRLEAIRQDIERLDKLIRQIAYEPQDAAPRHDAGMVALRLGRDDDGVRWLQSALRCPGDHRASHAVLADYFAQHDDPREDLHRRLAQGP